MANSVMDWAKVYTRTIRNLLDRRASKEMALFILDHMDFESISSLIERSNNNEVVFGQNTIGLNSKAGRTLVKVDFSTGEITWNDNGTTRTSTNIYDPFMELYML